MSAGALLGSTGQALLERIPPAALAEPGCTDAEIASITGHGLKHVHAILDMYMSRTKALNYAAVSKLEGTWITQVGL